MRLLFITSALAAAALSSAIVTNTSTNNSYPTIQAAVTAANPGNELVVDPGTYVEQVVIDKSLTLKGGGPGAIVKAVPDQIGASIKVQPGVSDVNIENLTLLCDPSQQNTGQGGDSRLRGIWFNQASGTVDSVSVINYRRNTGFFGVQEGNGIELRGSIFDGVTTWDNTLTVTNCLVTGYQKTGIIGNGNVKLIASGNTVTGVGTTPNIAQNGIQIGFGAKGIVEFNVISGNRYATDDVWSCGILIFDASGVRSRGNQMGDNQHPFGNFGRGTGNVRPD
jgi:nitrous oxidase accessory protein NosD